MTNSFTALYKKSGNWYAAWIEEISGVNTQGRTLKEARDNLKEALSLVIEANRLLNKPKSKAGIIRGSVSVPRASRALAGILEAGREWQHHLRLLLG